nr:ethylene-responsive transcription factor ERF109-like [Ipomoea trifida]
MQWSTQILPPEPFSTATNCPSPLSAAHQEFSTMVSALQNVMNGGDANFDSQSHFSSFSAAASTTTTLTSPQTAFQGFAELPPLQDTCQLCKYEGCLGCNFFAAPDARQMQPRQEIVQENSENGTNWSAPARMELRNGDEEFQEWMRMLMDFNDVSSDYILQL